MFRIQFLKDADICKAIITKCMEDKQPQSLVHNLSNTLHSKVKIYLSTSILHKQLLGEYYNHNPSLFHMTDKLNANMNGRYF
jgi:hypothetical protein